MSVRSARRTYLLGSSALLALVAFSGAANAQVKLPEVQVTSTRAKPKPHPAPARQAASAPVVAPLTPAEQLTAKSNAFDQSRSNLYTTIGTTSSTQTHATIDALPQGTNQTVERALLQAPGVSQDSATSGLLHIRNDHANVQYRINGVMLPDGVSGFGSFLSTSWIGTIALVTGALPAEFGMRTVGLVDITTRADVFNNSGSVGFYGGSRGTITPTLEYGGTFGGNCPSTSSSVVTKAPPAAWSDKDCFAGVQYYFSGRYLRTTEGIENPTPMLNAIHDVSRQENGFGYMSTFIDPATRLSLITGTSYSTFQIPNNPGQPVGMNGNPPVTSAFGVTNFNSALLNENQREFTQFGVLALQRSTPGFDGQISYFTRYSNLHFIPDPIGDLLFNGIASDISRQSYTNGIQGDASYVVNAAHTLRAGFTVSAEKAWIDNTSLVQACGPACDGTDNVEPPFSITDDVAKLAWLAGVYVQDEWKITSQLTMNAGLRFDQMWQFTDANQLSPRLSFTYKPFENTTFHAGYARYFTPPVLVEAAPANIHLFDNTTGAPNAGQANDPVLPERSHYFDAGVVQKIPFGCHGPASRDCANLEVGLDAYYKIAQDLIDNGQFGQALVLSGFNYQKAVNQGIELSLKYTDGPFQAYANLAVAQQKATNVVSNQYLFDNTTPLADLGGLTEFQYIATHWIYTDHNQFVTASAGAIYQFCGRPATAAEMFGAGGMWPTFNSWCGTRLSSDMIFGSGLRDGDANIGTVAPYAQVNVGVAREFLLPGAAKPTTVRFDVVNLFDSIYQIRDGSGIGVFAPQFGPRRGYYAGVSQKF
ncbi:MAG TPA: TonB-dependent receptor [Xanthobacteraceae bacterium]|nr:TonB-dependent receptor [Xanthobacteraceae bacterium]